MAMKDKTSTARKLGKLFYILLITLTVAMLAMLGLWTALGNDVYLYVLIGLIPLYLANLIFHLVRSDKDYKRIDAQRSEFLAVARDGNASVVSWNSMRAASTFRCSNGTFGTTFPTRTKSASCASASDSSRSPTPSLKRSRGGSS